MDFLLSEGDRVKAKKSEKWNKYKNFNRGLKKFWNKKVTVILIIGGLETIPKNKDKRL